MLKSVVVLLHLRMLMSVVLLRLVVPLLQMDWSLVQHRLEHQMDWS
jgi:hypothetical protein